MSVLAILIGALFSAVAGYAVKRSDYTWGFYFIFLALCCLCVALASMLRGAA